MNLYSWSPVVSGLIAWLPRAGSRLSSTGVIATLVALLAFQVTINEVPSLMRLSLTFSPSILGGGATTGSSTTTRLVSSASGWPSRVAVATKVARPVPSSLVGMGADVGGPL